MVLLQQAAQPAHALRHGDPRRFDANPKEYTIYPTEETVLFARRHAEERVEGMRAVVPEAKLNALVGVTPDPTTPSCGEVPRTLLTRLADTTTQYGHPLYADDQWFWARLTREYPEGALPVGAIDSPALLLELRSRIPYTPGADGLHDG